MSLNAPTKIVWIIAVILGVLSLVGRFVAIPFVSANIYWLALVGLAILALATLFKKV